MKRLDLNSYSNDGWGISLKGFEAIESALSNLSEIKAIEFGSGFSTQFILDYAEHHHKPLDFTSFDNDKKYKHEFATLVELIQCNAKSYDVMFAEQKIDWSKFRKRFWRPKSRQKNCFYRIDETKLRDDYNFVMIDGPHGNGRNFAFLLLKNRIRKGYLFIDDFNHYDFLPRASSLLNLKEICRVEAPKDNFVLLEVLPD